MEGARVARSYWSVLLALKDINGCEPVNEKKLSNLEIWKFLQKNDFVFAHIAYFCCYKLQYFSGVSKKGGPEAKHKFLKKVSKKGGSVQKRGCPKKGYHRCTFHFHVKVHERPMFTSFFRKNDQKMNLSKNYTIIIRSRIILIWLT